MSDRGCDFTCGFFFCALTRSRKQFSQILFIFCRALSGFLCHSFHRLKFFILSMPLGYDSLYTSHNLFLFAWAKLELFFLLPHCKSWQGVTMCNMEFINSHVLNKFCCATLISTPAGKSLYSPSRTALSLVLEHFTWWEHTKREILG